MHDHVVNLSGELQWRCERRDAGHEGDYFTGVTDVIDAMTVGPAVPPVDVKIQEAMLRNAQFEGSSLPSPPRQAGTSS